jgi:hypothetical protein
MTIKIPESAFRIVGLPVCSQSSKPTYTAELKLIRDMRRRNPDLGMIELWSRLKKRGYTRCPESLFRVMRRMGMFPESKPKKKYQPKPYEQMTYPGERIQMLTLFEATAAKLHIRHKLIRPYTPRHNGKVERSHNMFDKPTNSSFFLFYCIYIHAQL